MDILALFVDVVLHLDRHLADLVEHYGIWVYAILFVVIFAETGLVVLPFLPGDSLLFVAGGVAAVGGMDIGLLIAVLSVAAILGNTSNYAIGRYLGPRVFQWEDSRFFNKRALQKTHAFYGRHGGKTVVLTRFMPLLRTFAPFVAGVGAMDWLRFTAFNIAGGLLWVVSLSLAGYWLGNQPVVKNNLSAVVMLIVIVSLMPAAIGWWRQRREGVGS